MGIEMFASPGLRWGLLLEDHPKASHSFELAKGTDVGIPEEYGGRGTFCVCTINIPGQTPIVAHKSIKDKGTADDWQVICTKTLGRALKKAGYPDNLKDLKALVVWRQRDAEINAIRSGVPVIDTPKPLELEVGAQTDPEEAPDSVDVEAESPDIDVDSQIVDAEIVEDEPETEPTQQSLDVDNDLLTRVKALSKEDKLALKAFIEENGGHVKPEDWDEFDIDLVEGWLS